MAALIEEYLVETARALGDAHSVVVDAIGDINTPGSSLFEIQQLRDLAANGLPRFGILATNPTGFAVSVATSQEIAVDSSQSRYVTVSAGQVAFNGQRLAVPPQRIPLFSQFAWNYGSNAQYGIRLGLPLSEVKRALAPQVTTVSAYTVNTATELPITDISVAQQLGFPLQAQVGTKYLLFVGINQAGTALVVDPGFGVGGSQGTVQGFFNAGDQVYFLYDPRVLAVYGAPVTSPFQSGGDPNAYSYYPWMPRDWLPIANLLAVNPLNPSVVLHGGTTPAIVRTVVEWPDAAGGTPLFGSSDAATILRECDSMLTSLRQFSSESGVAASIQALQQYTSLLAGGGQVSFRAYWATQPFEPSSYFDRGVSFESLERLEFPDSFAAAYFDVTGQDLQHTFAIFRGDRYDVTSALVGTSPAGVAGTSIIATPVPSTLSRGTYIYGVSAVLTTGETAPTYISIKTPLLPGSYLSTLQWNQVPGALFYNVYRRATVAGDVTEYRISSDYQITGYGKLPDSSVTTPTVDEALFASGTSNQVAIRLIATGGTRIGGITVRLKSSAVITNATDSISVVLHTDNSGVPGAAVNGGTGTEIPYSAIGTGYTDLTVLLDAPLTTGATYWVVLTPSAAPVDVNSSAVTIKLARGTTGTGSYAQYNGSAWTAVNSKDCYYKVYAFLDDNRAAQGFTRRGIKLTGKIALQPRRLSVYVPPMSTVTTGIIPSIADDNTTLPDPEDTSTANELQVTVIARNGENGTPVTLGPVTVPQGTGRGTRFLLGTTTQLFDRVDDVQVLPGSAVTTGANNLIAWSVYDLVTVETVP